MYSPIVMKEDWIYEVNQKYARYSDAVRLYIKDENLSEIRQSAGIIIQYANSLMKVHLLIEAKKDPTSELEYNNEDCRQQFERLWEKDAWVLFYNALKFITNNTSLVDALIAIKEHYGGLKEMFQVCDILFGIKELPVHIFRYVEDRLRPRSKQHALNVHKSLEFHKLSGKAIAGMNFQLNDSIIQSYTEILSAALFPEIEKNEEDKKREAEIGKKVLNGARKGANLVRSNGLVDMKKAHCYERYDFHMRERHKLSEVEIRKLVAAECRVSQKTVGRYLSQRQK